MREILLQNMYEPYETKFIMFPLHLQLIVWVMIHLLGVNWNASTNQRKSVKPWFDGKIKFHSGSFLTLLMLTSSLILSIQEWVLLRDCCTQSAGMMDH